VSADVPTCPNCAKPLSRVEEYHGHECIPDLSARVAALEAALAQLRREFDDALARLRQGWRP